MYLWDYEMESYKDPIERLFGGPRLRVVIDSIEWTLRTLDPPIEDAESVDFIRSTLDQCRRSLEAGNVAPELSDAVDARIGDLEEAKGGITGVPNLLSALTSCFGYDEPKIRGQAVYDALSSCYEAALLVEAARLGAEIDLDFERLNDRCHAVIEHQKALVDDAR